MVIRIPPVASRSAATLAVVAGVVLSGAAPLGGPALRPHPQSALATDGTRIFAVAPDRQTLLVAVPGRSNWSAVATVPGARIHGLAWSKHRLFFTDTAAAAVRSIATRGGDRTVAVVHQGRPFETPLELAAGGDLVVADAGAQALFRLQIDGAGDRAAGAPEPIPIGTALTIGETTFITAWADEVLISDSRSGLLAQLRDITKNETKFRAMQERSSGDAPVPWNQRGVRPETVRRQGYPGVHSPGPVAVFNGILYTIDMRSGALFAAGVHDARAIRLPVHQPDAEFSRLVAGPLKLFALDARAGRVVELPRVVPSELTLLPGARPQSLFPVLEYLHKRRLLATRQLAIQGSVDDTLAQARMTWPGRGTPAEPVTREGHYASFCMLNPKLCDRGLPLPNLRPGTPIVLAELYAERYTAAAHVELDGSASLGQVADEAILSDEFKALKTEEHLRRLNGIAAGDVRTLREERKGTFRISQELVRYVIPIEASELHSPSTEFARLRERVRATLRISPLERVPTTAASATSRAGDRHHPQHPSDPACTAARDANARLLQAIDYAGGSPARTVFVGVAENDFDHAHPDFADPNGISVLYEVGDASDLVPMPPPAAGWHAPDGEPATWRDFQPQDHGTAVAAIIAGRQRPYLDGNGLTRSLVAMFTHTDDATALATDIDRAVNASPMTIVNLSLKAQREALRLRDTIEDKREVALFVIAAPNTPTQVTLCEGQEVWYPACYGTAANFINVLVVGGTTLEGDRIHARSPVGKAVHLFAPAAGFFSAGRNRGYVPVEGTSFATALVSAAASMLSSAGVREPALIRNRLIATATVLPLNGNPLWARRLNIRRALTHFRHAVFVDPTGPQPGQLTTPERVLQFRARQGNTLIPVSLKQVRRLKRVETDPAVFELAYTAGERGQQLELRLVRAPAEAWEACYLPVDAQGQVVGVNRCVDLAELSDYVGPIE